MRRTLHGAARAEGTRSRAGDEDRAAREFAALVLDDNHAFEPHLAGLYRPALRLFGPGDASFMPVSGARLRPQTVWIPER